jgi:hypothetical protein
VILLDCGANIHFAARCLRLRANQRFTGTGMLTSMASGVSFAMSGRLRGPRILPEHALKADRARGCLRGMMSAGLTSDLMTEHPPL